MVDDFVDPVDGIRPGHAIEGREAQGKRAPSHHGSVTGQVIAVHRRSGHHDGEHVLDTSVGGKEYVDLVVRVDSGQVDDLVGKRVVVSFRP